MNDRPSCDGLCVTAADIGIPVDAVAYPHPGCPLHSPGLTCDCGLPDRCLSPTHGQVSMAEARRIRNSQRASVPQRTTRQGGDMTEPSPYELWQQALGDGVRYRQLLLEHGLLVPLKPGEKREPLPCGWPDRRVADADEPEQRTEET